MVTENQENSLWQEIASNKTIKEASIHVRPTMYGRVLSRVIFLFNASNFFTTQYRSMATHIIERVAHDAGRPCKKIFIMEI